jgi:hypothetical protein
MATPFRTALVKSVAVTNASGITVEFKVPRGAKGFAVGAFCTEGGTLLVQAKREDGAGTAAWDTVENGSITLSADTRADDTFEIGGGHFRIDYTPTSDSSDVYIDFAELSTK